ncbi:DUF4255 domain-containing protein [Aquiflexum sp.]|uniref:DUF4255 domain-containing protein n=1 Tax=Aquiflexum sp. TaxID=1872584 RepID=UPI0035947743
MIDITLTYIRDSLNQHLKNNFTLTENKVVLSNLVENDGSSSREVEDKVVLFLIQLDEETSLKNSRGRGGISGGAFAERNAPLFLNLHVFCCTNFRGPNYIEGLNYLSAIVRYFQQNRILFPAASLGFSNKIEKLSFELCKLNYDQMSNIWSSIGAKLLPSVLYKVGLVVMDDSPISKITPAISGTNENVTN